MPAKTFDVGKDSTAPAHLPHRPSSCLRCLLERLAALDARPLVDEGARAAGNAILLFHVARQFALTMPPDFSWRMRLECELAVMRAENVAHRAALRRLASEPTGGLDEVPS